MPKADDLPLEQLAMAAHSLYCADKVAQGFSSKEVPALVPWEQLREDLRQANRAQVTDIPHKLALMGYELTPGAGEPASEIHFTSEEIDRLAKREHERWMEERQEMGWRFAPDRDNARKLHPSLLPWENLPASEKEKDRAVIRNLPKLIDAAGLRLRKRVSRK